MVPAGGLADDEDAHGRGILRQRRIRQGDLLHVLPLFGGLVAEGIDDIGPRHQEAAQFRGIAVDPGPVLHVPEHEHEEGRHAAADPAQEPFPGTVLHLAPEHVNARHDAEQEDVQDEREGEEARRLGILRPEHVPHHLVRHEHIVVVHEIEHHGVAEQGERHDALAHEAEQPHQHVVQQEVQHKQQEGGRHGDDDAVGAGFHVGKEVPEERHVERHERENGEHEAPDRQGDFLTGLVHRLKRYLSHSRTVSPNRTRSSRLYRMVQTMLTRWGVSSKGLAARAASYRAKGLE